MRKILLVIARRPSFGRRGNPFPRFINWIAAPCKKRRARNDGFILVTLLILLSVLSLLAIYGMNSSILHTKMTHNFFQETQRINDADIVVRRAESIVERTNNWSCKLNSNMPEYVLTVKNTQGLPALKPCRINLAENRQGYYVIQLIQQKNCLEYYRITGWVHEGVLVQSTYAKLLNSSCDTPKSTRLSWRLLSK